MVQKDAENPEQAGRPGAHGPTRVYERDGQAVRWDASRCLHVAACIRAEPGVFDPKRRPWVELDGAAADAVARAVRLCPTGALRLVDDEPGTGVDRATVVVRPDGPYYATGAVSVVAADGTPVDQGTRAALCRCGASGNKPFCDGSHTAVGFRSGPDTAHEAAAAEAAGPALSVTMSDSPYHVEGAVVQDRRGEVLDASGDCWLCSCGHSGSKPFCDGSHKRFRAGAQQ